MDGCLVIQWFQIIFSIERFKINIDNSTVIGKKFRFYSIYKSFDESV